MADIKIGNGGLLPSTNNPPTNAAENADPTKRNAGQTGSAVNLPVGQPGESEQLLNMPKPPSEKLFSDAVTGRDQTQVTAAELLRGNAGVSATDKLLGLHLQPTVTGALTAPPGNMEALRHLSPSMRRSVMREMLTKQRERTKRLAQLVRRQRDQHGDGEKDQQQDREDSFVGLLTDGLTEGVDLSDQQVERATVELVAMAKMLDLLDEMLNMQDYTFSQMGSFAQG